MLRRLAPLALATALVLPSGAGAAEPNNLVPPCQDWTAGREFYAPSWALTSTLSCSVDVMRIGTGGGEQGLHWQIEGGRSSCVETPGIASGPRPISFRHRSHVYAVQFGYLDPGVTLFAIAYDGAGCTGTASPRSLLHSGGSADTWLEAAGSVELPAGTQSVALEVASGCPVGVTCLKESPIDLSRILVDRMFLAGDGLVVSGCDDPDLTGMTEVNGDLVIQDVSGCGGDLVLPDLVQVGGDLVIEDTDAGAIDVGSVASVGGDLSITGNGSAGVIDLSSLGSVAGSVSIEDNMQDTVVDLGSLVDVAGSASIESAGVDLDLGGVSVGTDLDVTGLGSDSVSGTTAGGATSVGVLGGTAAMSVFLPDGAFALPVPFRVERVGDEPPAGEVDPVAGYHFTFGVPALGADAGLAFTVDLAQLDSATRGALLAGVANERATLAVRGDETGATYRALPRCPSGGTPEESGCVSAVVLGADGQPAADGTEAAFIRFEGVAGHFSTWAVALVSPPAAAPPTTAPSGDTGTTRPSNVFSLGRLNLNRRRGTAALAVAVPGGGELVLRGRGVRRVRRSVAGGRAVLAIRPAGVVKRRLSRRGRATVRLSVTYLPVGGEPRTRTKRVTLVKRRR